MGDFILALAVHNVGVTGQLVAGGAFTTADGESSAFWSRWGPVCAPGDLDEDGNVAMDDFAALLAGWGACPQPCPPFCAGDLDGNCQAGIADFLTLLANWSP